MREHLRFELTKELFSKLVNDDHFQELRQQFMSGLWRMTDIQLSEIAKGLQKLETTAKFEFAQQP